MNLTELCKIGINAALEAGEIIKENSTKDIKVKQKIGGESYASQVVTQIDKDCETIILSHLLPTCETNNIAMLTEETEDDGSRLKKDFFWCIDPMDGTLAFINKHPGYSVSIALIAKDGTPYIGIVYNPSTRTLYHAIKGQGAFKNKTPWVIKNNNTYLSYVTDRTLENTKGKEQINDFLNKLVQKHNFEGIKEISGAGSVMNAILVLENGPACMLKLPKKEDGGGSLWDFGATACIYNELNDSISATGFNGERLELNRKESTFLNHQGVLFSNL